MASLVLDFCDLSCSVPSEFPGWMVWCLTHVGNDLAIIPSSIVPVVFSHYCNKTLNKNNFGMEEVLIHSLKVQSILGGKAQK